MDIYFKDTYGNRVGYINGTDIWNNNGSKVGYISGSEIRSTSGSRPGMLNGSDIKDTYGNRVGYINGTDIKDTYGNRVGYAEGSASDIEMAAAALLLFDWNGAESNETASRPQRRQWEKPDGVAGWIGVILVISILQYLELFWCGFWIKYTAERKDWWRTLGCTLLFAIISAIIVFGIAHAESISAVVVWLILTLFPIVVVSFSRVRDAGKPWWLTLIPGANFIICGFFPSEY